MAAATYEEALRRLLAHEGGYTNHPADPGGPTNFGITIYDYRKYVKPGATAEDVKAMRLDEAKAIYRAKYWDSQKCDLLEPGVDYAMFDYGVNSGIGRSGKVLRRVLGLPDDSSEVTPAVIEAANAMHAATLCAQLCDERLRFLKSLKTWSVFGTGWGRRVAEVRSYALAIASDMPVAAGAPLQPAPGRAVDPVAHGVAWAQQALNDLGAEPQLTIDGDPGPNTRAMLKAFQAENNIPQTGQLDGATVAELEKHLTALSAAASAPAAATAPRLLGQDVTDALRRTFG